MMNGQVRVQFLWLDSIGQFMEAKQESIKEPFDSIPVAK